MLNWRPRAQQTLFTCLHAVPCCAVCAMQARPMDVAPGADIESISAAGNGATAGGGGGGIRALDLGAVAAPMGVGLDVSSAGPPTRTTTPAPPPPSVRVQLAMPQLCQHEAASFAMSSYRVRTQVRLPHTTLTTNSLMCRLSVAVCAPCAAAMFSCHMMWACTRSAVGSLTTPRLASTCILPLPVPACCLHAGEAAT